MKVNAGAVTCVGLAAMCALSALVIVTSKDESIEQKENKIRQSITLFDDKKMYSEAAAKYKELVNLNTANYKNIIEYRDYCIDHEFQAESAQASLKAIRLKEQTEETDFDSAKIYLKWLSDTDDKDKYAFVKECMGKYSGDEKNYFSDFYDSIKGDYRTFGGKYLNFGDWHNTYVRQDNKYYYGGEYYAFAEDRYSNRCVIDNSGSTLLTAPEIMSYSFEKKLAAAHHEEQLVYLDASRQRKIVPYNTSENKLLNYDYLGAYYKNIANFSVDGKWGYINANADVITDQYEYATPFVNGVAAVKENGSWHFITISDNNLVALTDERFDDVKLDEYGCPFSYGYAYVKKTGSGKWSLISLTVDVEKKKISGIRHIGSQEFDDVKPFGAYGAVKSGEKWGFIDADGEWVLEPTFEDAKSIVCGLAPVKIDGKWGYADITGKIIIDARFEDAVPFNLNGIAAVKSDGVFRMIQLQEYAD